jgi:hypothetical protein
MTEILFVLNVLLVAVLLIEGLWLRTGYLQVPFLSALIYAIWFLPQAMVLLDDPSLPPGSMATLLTMSLLSLAAIWLGWRQGVGHGPFEHQRLAVPEQRLVLPVLAITLFAAAMRALILAQPDSLRASTQWTGPITIMAFFAQVGIVSLVLSLAMVMRRRTPATLALAAANVGLYAAPLLIYFRRGETSEFILATLLCLFFVRGKRPPRAAIAAGLVLAFAFINGVGYLRALGGGYTLDDAGKIETRIPTLDEISQIDWFTLQTFEESKYRSETRNAAMYMAVTDETGSLSLGSEIWNLIIQAYVPGQIVGFEFKHSLMIGDNLTRLAQKHGGYETYTGTTSTGFTYPYRDFWFFGAAVFFLVSRFMARQFLKAHAGSLEALSLYAIMLPLSLLAVTHYGYYVLINTPLPGFAAWAAFKFARPSSPRRLAMRQGMQALQQL